MPQGSIQKIGAVAAVNVEVEEPRGKIGAASIDDCSSSWWLPSTNRSDFAGLKS
jgi:hypothetical protein